jgi:hypothetical protein
MSFRCIPTAPKYFTVYGNMIKPLLWEESLFRQQMLGKGTEDRFQLLAVQ